MLLKVVSDEKELAIFELSKDISNSIGLYYLVENDVQLDISSIEHVTVETVAFVIEGIKLLHKDVNVKDYSASKFYIPQEPLKVDAVYKHKVITCNELKKWVQKFEEKDRDFIFGCLSISDHFQHDVLVHLFAAEIAIRVNKEPDTFFN